MNCKAAETTHNNNALGPGTANECTVQWWFKKITALKMRSGVASHQLVSVDYDQLRAIIKAGPLTTMWETVEELNFNNSMVLGIWSILERWKILVSGCLMSWLLDGAVLGHCELLLLLRGLHGDFHDLGFRGGGGGRCAGTFGRGGVVLGTRRAAAFTILGHGGGGDSGAKEGAGERAGARQRQSSPGRAAENVRHAASVTTGSGPP